MIGDRVIVRGEVTGTPAGELFGVPHTGKSFRWNLETQHKPIRFGEKDSKASLLDPEVRML